MAARILPMTEVLLGTTADGFLPPAVDSPRNLLISAARHCKYKPHALQQRQATC